MTRDARCQLVDFLLRKNGANLRAVFSPYDDRIGWPDVVQYEYTSSMAAGLISPFAPRVEPGERETPTYLVLVYDQGVYDLLRAAGCLDHPAHTGPKGGRVDHRKAPAG